MSKNTNLSFLTDYITADITNGRIGINNASPTVAFDVVGATKITGALTVSGAINLSSSATFPTVGLFNRTSDTTLYMVASPSGFALLDNSQNTMYIATPTSHIWAISNIEKMRITSAGNVGIGTSNPFGGATSLTGIAISDRGGIFKLSVNDTLYYSNNLYYDGTNWKRITANGGSFIEVASPDGGQVIINAAATGTAGSNATIIERMRINASGVVSINSLGSGAVTATSGVLSTTSDMTLKIEDGFIDNALEKISQLKPRYFYWKEESGLPTDIRQLGFYAQEVNQALGEEAANTPKNENDKWGIYDRGIIAMLTKGIQELKAEIETLKNK